MVNRLGLWIGNSFAELSADFSHIAHEQKESPPQKIMRSRWFLPRLSLQDGVKAALAPYASSIAQSKGTIRISTSKPRWLLERAQGQNVACLVTAGFEKWLQAHAPTTTDLDSDLIFPIQERMTPNGVVTVALDLAALTEVADKLIEKQIQNVVLTFLHASANPLHEKQAHDYLSERGLKVFASHRITESDERRRWRRALECGVVEARWQEEMAQLETTLCEILPASWSAEIWSENGLLPIAEARIENIWSGVEASLLNYTAKSSQTLCLGLEDFYLLSRHQEKTKATCRFTALQPTLEIGPSEWAFPQFTDRNRGFEPGPMIFGKSHQLTLLDILALRGRLKFPVEGFSERLSERPYPRILETLYTMGKSAGRSPMAAADSRFIAADLEFSAAENLASDCIQNGARDIQVCGALAESLLPWMKMASAYPQLSISSNEDANWTMSEAALASGSDLT